MNKGKPSGFIADTKRDAGARSTLRPRRGQAGVGPEWTQRNTTPASRSEDEAAALAAAVESNGASEPVNPFPELRNGASSNGSGKSRIIHFEFQDGDAQKVFIAGTFNEWHPNASEMIAIGNGKWMKDLTLNPGEYEYRFVADGRWINDPGCKREKPNGFGESNSVILVPEV